MTKTYTTKQGDMWDAIAYCQMGDVSYTDKLLLLNQQYHHIYIFPAGLVLVLPEPQAVVSASLPPWKQVLT